MAEAGEPLLVHLHKIPATTSEETLDEVLQILWDTRKSGLGSNRKPEIQTLLGLPNSQPLDPVLASIRAVIRTCISKNVSGDDIQSLFPVDLSVDLRRILVNLLQKRQNQWREEAARDKPLWQGTRVSHQIKVSGPPLLGSFSSSEPLMSLWPRQDDATSYPKSSDAGCSVSGFADPRHPCTESVPLHAENSSSENMVMIPRLKSMTWTMENRGITQPNRVAVITLKMQDYTKSPSGEIEVKFQLTKDTLDAMLRSMTYISEQLSKTMASRSEPSPKRQRQ